MRIGRVLVVAGYSWIGGIGAGLALLGEWQRAFAWLATLPLVALLGVLVSPWCLMLLFVVMLGAMAHAIARAVRSEAPLRLFSP